MNDLRVCTKGAGFAVVGALSVTALTLSAYGQGGDTPGSAVPIAAGVTYFGTTAGYTNYADATCPYTGSTSPDVFYTYTNDGSSFEVSLCDSGYDSKVYCFDENGLLPTKDGSANGVACNDDACSSSGGGGFRSIIGCVQQSPSGTAFIAVDGWGGAFGPYEILVTDQLAEDCIPPGPCLVPCPPGATVEPDDCDFGNTAPNDQVNGGCNASPPAFTPIACEETVCGTGFFDGAFRDTDWWELDNTGAGVGTTYTMTGTCEFNYVFGRVDNGCGALDCSQVAAFAEFGVFAACDPGLVETARLESCLAWFFVGPDFTEIIDCNQPAGGPPNEVGENYVLTVECVDNLPPCPWDLDGDQIIGFGDLLKILSFWGPCPGT